MKKLRIGIVGCGGIANQKHLPSLKANADKCEIVAFCDIIEEFVEDFVMKFGIFDIFAIDSALIEAGGHEAAGMDVTAFREGDQFFDDAAKFFRFGFSRLNGFVIEKLCRERIEHSITMRGRTTEMTTRFTMSHSI